MGVYVASGAASMPKFIRGTFSSFACDLGVSTTTGTWLFADFFCDDISASAINASVLMYRCIVSRICHSTPWMFRTFFSVSKYTSSMNVTKWDLIRHRFFGSAS